MSYGFERVGPLAVEDDVLISMDDAERLRSIGQNLIMAQDSSQHITESTISAALVASVRFRVPILRHDNEDASSVYGYAEEVSYGNDGWRSLIKYHWYGKRDGSEIGFESDYVVDVFDNEVILAKRSLYRLREFRDVCVKGGQINIESMERRTMADTQLEGHHIDRIEERINRLIKRTEGA
jgi:hypothetical protein